MKREACCQCHSKSYQKNNVQRANNCRDQAGCLQRDRAPTQLGKMPPKGKNRWLQLKKPRNLSYCFWILFGLFFLASGKKPGNHQSYWGWDSIGKNLWILRVGLFWHWAFLASSTSKMNQSIKFKIRILTLQKCLFWGPIHPCYTGSKLEGPRVLRVGWNLPNTKSSQRRSDLSFLLILGQRYPQAPRWWNPQ